MESSDEPSPRVLRIPIKDKRFGRQKDTEHRRYKIKIEIIKQRLQAG